MAMMPGGCSGGAAAQRGRRGEFEVVALLAFLMRDLTTFRLASLTRAAQGERQRALVGGPAGAGKVRLVFHARIVFVLKRRSNFASPRRNTTNRACWGHLFAAP